jgi:hypothetical protein
VSSPNAVYVSPDGGIAVPRDVNASPSAAQCTLNRGSGADRSKHFSTMEAAFRCARPGDTIFVNAMNSAGVIVPYREVGFGWYSKPAPPSGTAAAFTRVVGRCNGDAAANVQTFTRDSCKVLIRPQAADWGLTVSATDSAPATSSDAGKGYFMYFTRADHHHIAFDNFEMDGSTGLLDGGGEWNGANCQCRAGGFARVDYPASDFLFDHLNVHDTVGGALYTYSAVGGAATNVVWQNGRSHHNGWNYLGSMSTRFGAIGGSPTCSTNPGITGCPAYYGEYYSHMHSFYFGSAGNSVRNNYIYDDAGYCFQSINSSTWNVGANSFTGNWVANCGWKSKQVNHSLNAVGGWNLQYANGSVIANNVFVNNVGGYVFASNNMTISGNVFVRGAKGNGNGTYSSVLHMDASRSASFTNNILCFNRDDAGGSDDTAFIGNAYNLPYVPASQSINRNGQSGPVWNTGESVFALNSGNTFGGCANDRLASQGYVPTGGAPTRDASLIPGSLLSLVA